MLPTFFFKDRATLDMVLYIKAWTASRFAKMAVMVLTSCSTGIKSKRIDEATGGFRDLPAKRSREQIVTGP